MEISNDRKREIIQMWVTALRSGHYKQGQRALNSGTTYCCLGVLVEELMGAGWRITREQEPGDDASYNYLHGERSSTVLPSVLAMTLGMDDCGLLKMNGEAKAWMKRKTGVSPSPEVCLIHLNDDYRLNFDQIAEFIERFPEQIFSSLGKD